MNPVSLFVFGALYALVLTQLIVAVLVFFFGGGTGDHPGHWITAIYLGGAALAEGVLVFLAQIAWIIVQRLRRNARQGREGAPTEAG